MAIYLEEGMVRSKAALPVNPEVSESAILYCSLIVPNKVYDRVALMFSSSSCDLTRAVGQCKQV